MVNVIRQQEEVLPDCDSRQFPLSKRDCPIKSSGYGDIIKTSIYLILPISALTIALAVYVLERRVESTNNSASLFTEFSTAPMDNAFYVRAESTTLVFLASCMSTFATLSIGFQVNLVSYPVAQHLYEATVAQARVGCLPTAYQLFIILKLANGSACEAYWALFRYSFCWTHRKSPRSPALTCLSLSTVLFTLLSGLVFGASTWLHFTTATVSLTQINAIPPHSVLHSFEQLSSCMLTNNSYIALQEANISCTTTTKGYQPEFLNPVLTSETLSNQSMLTSVMFDTKTNLSYLNPSFDTLDPTIDFVATRYALRTSCKPISRACNLSYNGNVTFSCSNGAFSVNDDTVSQNGFARQVYKLPDLSDMDDSTQVYGVHNPFYIGAATINDIPRDSPLWDDPEFVALPKGISGVFSCSVTVLDVQYAYNNGQIYDLSVFESSTSVTNMFTSIIVGTTFGYENERAALNLAAITTDNAQDFADQYAAILSNTILASGAGSVQIVPVHIAQQRISLQVSQVPKRPFGVLVGIGGFSVLLGVFLMLLAAMTTRDGRQAQYRLTIAGIVANLFDRENARKEWTTMEQLFGEYHGAEDSIRVGIDRTSKRGLAWTTIGLAPPSEVVIREVPVAHSEKDRGGISCLSRRELHYEYASGRNDLSIRRHERWSCMY